MNIIRTSKWDEECRFELKPSDQHIKMLLKNVGFIKGFNDGHGIDAFIKLSKKPQAVYIDFDYESKNLVAYHQPELTALEISSGCFRLEYAINSIALYHSFKKNNQYKNGKFGHLYRPLLVDANGFSSWCNWTKEKAGIFRLWLDETFLKIAKYPMTIMPVGDTFGNTTLPTGGSESGDFGNSSASSDSYTATGTGTSMSLYADSGTSGTIQLGIYTISGSTGTKIGNTGDSPTISAAAWYTINFGVQPTFNGANYYFFWQPSANDMEVWYDATPDANFGYQYSVAYGTWDNNPTVFTSGAKRQYGIYCTYTPSVAGGPKSFIPLGFIHGR